MSACILVLYTTLSTLAAARDWQDAGAAHDAREAPERLYAARESIDRAKEAAAAWHARLQADASDFESAWKLARVQYWIGGHVAPGEVKQAFEAGIAAADRAVAIHPARPEGHFWRAANMGGLAESQGMTAGLRYRTPIREALERVLAIDPAYEGGAADRALGRWYYKVPRLFGGNKQKSEAHLRAALTYDPRSTVTWFFLAETLLALDRDDEARAAFQKVLEVPLHPEWTPEDREFKAKARARISGKGR
jgi:tetratricopeptide (TPR) repeat protein